MPYDAGLVVGECIVCTCLANILREEFRTPNVVNCSRCGDFQIARTAVVDHRLPSSDPKLQALASYTIRRLQVPGAARPNLTPTFFQALEKRALPSPMDQCDNLVLWLAENADESPGKPIMVDEADPHLWSTIGAIGRDDAHWVLWTLKAQGLIDGRLDMQKALVNLTVEGWKRNEQLKRYSVSSRFAFFARKFNNADLDQLFDTCLYPAVKETGYELRKATQRAGLIDAVIEDEIRRCRFVIADLSDDNAGAYWEAGLAEGLGKDVIYICRKSNPDGTEKATHFDTNHRQTVKWDLDETERTATELKAVIRNTLLGDANQSDD
jgi:hypothetical protein